MHDQQVINVLKIGQSLASHGGVANQQRRLIAHLPPTVHVVHVSTMLARVGVSRLTNLGRFAVALLRITFKLAVHRPDVVHLYISQRGSVWRKLIIVALARTFRVPVIIHSQGSEIHLFYNGLPRPFRRIVSIGLRSCTRVIVLSESWKRFFVDKVGLDPARVVVIPNSVEIPPTIPDRRGRATVSVVFLGRIGLRKGAFELIEAFATLPEKLRDMATLILGGDGETRRASDLARRLSCADQVQILGWIDDDERNAVLRDADVFVLPTHNEGLPLALLDAMGWGVASISTPVGGIPEVLVDEDNGLMVEPGNVEEIRHALSRLIEDEALRLRLGREGRRTAEQLDVHIHAQQLTRLYESLVNPDRKQKVSDSTAHREA